jgi:DNA-binding transcriptional MerR regulator
MEKAKKQQDQYDELRARYPKYISKDQLYRICRIAKRTAKYLLDNGIIPCTDTGKRTRRYKVALEDIIAYMKKREKHGSQVPCGAVNSKPSKAPKISFSQVLSTESMEDLRRYFEYIYDEFPDVVNIFDLGEMTGLSHVTLLRYVKQGIIQSLLVDRRLMIPKQYVADFVTGHRFLNIKSNSEGFHRILGGYAIWKEQKL